MQKTLQIAKEPYLSVYLKSIGPHLDSLKSLNFGPRLYSKLTQTYHELFNFVNEKKKNFNSNNNNINNVKNEKYAK